MGFSVVTPQTIEPLTLAEAKTQLRVLSTNEDDLITALIVAAREYAENFTGRALITRTLDYSIDAFPAAKILIPIAPISSVVSVKYVDGNGSVQTWDATKYVTDLTKGFGEISLAFGETFPTARSIANAITIRINAGYGANADSVPQSIKQAMLMLISHWFDNRAGIAVGVQVAEMPLAVEHLLWSHRMVRFG